MPDLKKYSITAELTITEEELDYIIMRSRGRPDASPVGLDRANPVGPGAFLYDWKARIDVASLAGFDERIDVVLSLEETRLICRILSTENVPLELSPAGLEIMELSAEEHKWIAGYARILVTMLERCKNIDKLPEPKEEGPTVNLFDHLTTPDETP